MAKWQPHAYQRRGVTWLVKHPEAALLWEPGCGKTTVTLSAFQALKKSGGVKKALVIAPRRVCQMVWTHDEGGELAKWENFADLRVTLLHGDDKDDRLEEDADLYVLNPAGLKWLTSEGRLLSLLKRGVDTLIVDELSRFKHTTTQQFKLLKPFLPRFRRRWGLTGSPASNGLINLFGQIYVLDLGRRLGRYITHYRHQYFVPSGYGGYDWQPQEGAEERIYKALSDCALSLRAADHLDMPELVERDLWVVLPEAARKAYEDLEEDLITQIETDVVTAANAAVASGKCRQVASGGLYVEDGGRRTTKHLHDEKTEALKELVEELQGSPLLVVYEFDHDLERIRKALGREVPAINGATTPKQTAELVNAWNRGELPLLCGHPAAMGHGLNLQASGHHVCWYSLTWDFELYDQTIRRVWRQGQRQQVIVHRLLARNTLDEVVAKTLRTKQRVQDALLEALKRRRRRTA